MAEILDENGVPFPYWPISGLAAGENSQVMILRVRAEADAFLYASADPRATVYGRARDTVQWFDLAQDPPGLETGTRSSRSTSTWPTGWAWNEYRSTSEREWNGGRIGRVDRRRRVRVSLFPARCLVLFLFA